MKLFFIPLICFLLLSSGCSKYQNNKCEDGIKATLEKTRLAGCGWLLRLSNGDHLEPINLMDFNIHLRNGKRVRVSYIERIDMVSICMAGRIVEIKCIE